MPLTKRAIIEVMEKHKKAHHKPLLTDVQWVTFYCDLSDDLLEHMWEPNGHNRFVQDGSGDEVYTDDAQDAFEEIVAIVESHMYDMFCREGDDDE